MDLFMTPKNPRKTCVWLNFLKPIYPITIAFIVMALAPSAFCVGMMPGPGDTNSSPVYTPLDSWSFHDNTNWTSDKGYSPVSFTNLAYSYLGNGSSLVVNTDLPAWLQFHVVETNGATNFSPSIGTLAFWFAPSWSGTNTGGTGPGEYGRLFEAGAYTTNSSFGLWSLYADDVGANIYFSTQTNDLSGTLTTYLTAPIAWKTNYFHFIVLTYSVTNTALYLDGGLITNGPGLTVYPGPDALANGFFIGSDSSGVFQAQGLFNSVTTYNVPLDAGTVQQLFSSGYNYYLMSPWNTAMFSIVSAPYTPSTSSTPDVITGAGYLQTVGSVTPNYSTNANTVWITNITATTAGADVENVTFTVQGGQAGYFYDVFASGNLQSPLSSGVWFWMGQGVSATTYSMLITNSGSGNAFLILGTPKDSDGDGLTDAYEKLVSKTDPNNAFSNLDGILDGWEILLGLNPAVNNFTSQRSNYSYTGADWLNTITGVRNGTITTDNEGNVQTVSQ